MHGKFSVAFRFVLTLLIAASGGWMLWHMHMPLAWLLGAMIATGLAALLRLPVAMPAFARPPMTAMIGAMLGTAFQPSLFDHAAVWLVSLAGLALFIAAAGGVGYVFYRTFAGFDHPTAYFSAMPGGLVEMVTLAAERGGDEKTVALIHAARIFLVVLTLPFLIQLLTGEPIARTGDSDVPLADIDIADLVWFTVATILGAVLGKRLRLPASHLLGPMTASAILHLSGLTDFAIPAVALGFAQLVIGATVGCRFAMASPREILRIIGLSIGSTGLLLATSLGFAAILSTFTGDRFLALVLAYSPGGIAEVSIVALSIGIEVPFVVLHHIIRVMLVVAGSALLFRCFQRKTCS
jgi:membrane AbrB-like protein